MTTSQKIATLYFAQDGCAMVTYGNQFLVFPGSNATYRMDQETSSNYRDQGLFGLTSKS